MGYLFITLNLAFWGVMFLIEKWESQTGRISPRKKWNKNNPKESFLYLQDWNTGSWGDLVGLSLVSYVFGQVICNWSATSGLIAAIVSFMVTYFLYNIWKGRPDSGFPDGEQLSYMGKVHLFYTFLQVFIASYLVLSLKQMNSNLLIILLVGTLIYVASMLVDYKHGKLSK